jgi:hypothetical protein
LKGFDVPSLCHYWPSSDSSSFGGLICAEKHMSNYIPYVQLHPLSHKVSQKDTKASVRYIKSSVGRLNRDFLNCDVTTWRRMPSELLTCSQLGCYWLSVNMRRNKVHFVELAVVLNWVIAKSAARTKQSDVSIFPWKPRWYICSFIGKKNALFKYIADIELFPLIRKVSQRVKYIDR